MHSVMDREMTELNEGLIRLSGTAVGSMDALCAALEGKAGPEAASELYREAGLLAAEVERRCVRLLIHRQPVASDLRAIKAALRLIVDLSRVSEQSAHAAELTVDFGGYDRPLVMARLVRERVAGAIECYFKRDLDGAALAAERDDAVDEIFRTIRRELAEVLRAGSRDEWVLDCLLLSKYLERIADHAVNIARLAPA